MLDWLTNTTYKEIEDQAASNIEPQSNLICANLSLIQIHLFQ